MSLFDRFLFVAAMSLGATASVGVIGSTAGSVAGLPDPWAWGVVAAALAAGVCGGVMAWRVTR